jgi:hypothetical protein
MRRSDTSNSRELSIPSADEFVRLRSSSDPVEYHRAAHGHAELEVWWEVIRRFPEMRFWVAHNKTVPIEVLDMLASDPDDAVRTMVASKGKVTSEILRKLARDPNEGVRRHVVTHRDAPQDVLEALTTDSWDVIAGEARRRLG